MGADFAPEGVGTTYPPERGEVATPPIGELLDDDLAPGRGQHMEAIRA